MRVVFFGTPELAVPCLAAVAAQHTVVAVVSQPDRPAGRGHKLVPTPVKAWAEKHGLPVHQPTKLNDGTFESWLRAQQVEAGVLAAYGHLLKQPILDAFPRGIINMHPSLLPLYRGPSPIQSALRDGADETGVTIMRIALAMDAGDILLQEGVRIAPDEDAAALTARLSELGGQMLAEALTIMERGEDHWLPQDDQRATYCKLLRKEDGRIDWTRPAREIHNQIRACLPWPVAHCGFEEGLCRILRSEVEEAESEEPPGTILGAEDERLRVATGAGILAVREVQLPGKRAMGIGDFLRGHPLAPGARFENLDQ